MTEAPHPRTFRAAPAVYYVFSPQVLARLTIRDLSRLIDGYAALGQSIANATTGDENFDVLYAVYMHGRDVIQRLATELGTREPPTRYQRQKKAAALKLANAAFPGALQ